MIERFSIKDVLAWINCEKCSEERTFWKTPDDRPSNKYVYLDISWNTRCFCKQHMSYGKEWRHWILSFEDKRDYPLYWAELLSDIIWRLWWE